MLAYMGVIEYQKRGLPHAHILVILDSNDSLKTAKDVDSVICAEIPHTIQCLPHDSVENEQISRLQKIVLKCMIHGPCGERNPRAPCMVDGKCTKNFPKNFALQTSWSVRSSYPTYKRRGPADGGSTAVVGDYIVDNRFVVPYSPYLSLKYDAHINVEACVSPFAAKYLFLYINKV